jgi:four helix bundle protein
MPLTGNTLDSLLEVRLLLGQITGRARRAKSTADFINKLKIVEEECDESVYFLELLRAVNPDRQQIINPLITEGTEILKIIVASIVTVREKSSQQKK